MPGEVQTALEVPMHFSNPDLLIASAAVIAVGAAIEYFKTRRENGINRELDQVFLADPEAGAKLRNSARNTRLVERIGLGVAVAFGTFGTMDLAGPHATVVSSKGTTEIVENIGLPSTLGDMSDGNSRREDTISGAALASQDEPVPFNFLLDGSTAVPLQTSSTNKNPQTIVNKINSIIQNSPNLQNGDVLGDAAESAVGNINNQGGGNVILITSGLPTGNDSSLESAGLEQSNLQNAANNAKANTKLSVIVVGKGIGSYSLSGGVTVDKVAPDPLDYQTILGKKNASHVHSADSAKQIENEIDDIVSSTQIEEHDVKSGLYLDLAMLSATALAIVAASRRASGIIPRKVRSKFRRNK